MEGGKEREDEHEGGEEVAYHSIACDDYEEDDEGEHEGGFQQSSNSLPAEICHQLTEHILSRMEYDYYQTVYAEVSCCFPLPLRTCAVLSDPRTVASEEGGAGSGVGAHRGVRGCRRRGGEVRLRVGSGLPSRRRQTASKRGGSAAAGRASDSAAQPGEDILDPKHHARHPAAQGRRAR